MSYDLQVLFDELPDGLAGAWMAGFVREGFDAEIAPDFLPSTWEGGFLPMRVRAAPQELIGILLEGEAIGGFEVFFEYEERADEMGKRRAKAAQFRFGSDGPTLELAMMCVGAAILAELAGGRYVDPQTGDAVGSLECIALAKATVRRLLAAASDAQRVLHPFPGWEELGVTVEGTAPGA